MYREITDKTLFARNDALAFNDPIAQTLRWVDSPSMGPIRGVYGGGELVAQCVLFPLTLQTGEGSATAGGLGSVSVPPEHRGRGHLRTLLRGVAEELAADGRAWALLYPFDAAVYHRFGWASAVERKRYSGPPSLLAGFRAAPGRWRRVGDEAIADLDAVYRGAFRHRFGPLVRDERWWRHFALRPEFSSAERIAYCWYGPDGAPRAYLIYEVEGDGHTGRKLVCREIGALDAEARSQIFALLGSFAGQIASVEFPAPPDAPVNLLLPRPLRCEVEPYHMARILDVALALDGYRCPREASGRLTLAVRDEWLAHNQGTFTIEAAGGALRCSRLEAAVATDADLACDVGALAQIASRILRPRTAASFGLLEARSRAALMLAERVFAGLTPYSVDFF